LIQEMLAVETIDLTKDYAVGFVRKRPRRALDHLNLEVGTGEVFGLLGPNGAGKSTTLKLLLRLISPTSGTGRILGCELDDVAVHARIGFLPENPYFYDHLTAREFLNYAAELFGMGKVERRRRVGELLEKVGLAGSGDCPLRKFSKGMLQRVGIAQALVNDPEIVFLDEPMSGLDPLGRREVRDLILELKGAGKTIFFSTHILSDAEMLCDRVAILDLGKLQGCGELREILRLGASLTEIVLEKPSPEVLKGLEALSTRIVRTGERVRVEVPEESQVLNAIDVIARQGGRIVSLNPVKMSLEDYFMKRVGGAPDSARNSPNVESPVEEKS
jgi:ABC-2 type transport system ATP-binding protein